MKRIDLGQTIQILANIGVIAGIVFLAIEVRQANNAVKSSTLQAIAERTQFSDEFREFMEQRVLPMTE